MYIENELKNIAQRLFDEKICLQPLSDRDLEEVYRYHGMLEPCGELMRRLSDIEINYEEISSDADQAAAQVKEAILRCADLFKAMIDDWNGENSNIGYSFSVEKSDITKMYSRYSQTTGVLTAELANLTDACEILGETALQTKACSASFLEIYNETRLAFYAASLNRDAESILSCRAISMLAHDSSKECNARSSRYISASQAGSVALSVINSVISEITAYFSAYEIGRKFSPSAIVNNTIRGIEALNNIASSIKLL